MPADHRPRPADHPQERLRVRRLPPAQGRHARQPQHHRPAGRQVLAEQISGNEGRRRGVQRFPPRHLQPAHHPGHDQPRSRQAPSGSPTARWQAAGATSSNSRASTCITPNEREARFALADQDTGVRPLAAKLHEEARVQDRHPQARRSRRADLPRRPRRATSAPSSSSTALPATWSTQSAPAMRLLAYATLVDAGRQVRGGGVGAGLDGGGAGMRARRQYSDRPFRPGRADRRRREAGALRISAGASA